MWLRGLDLGVQHRDVGVDPVDTGQHLGQQKPVMVIEVAGERLRQLRDLDPHPGPGHLREHLRVAFPGRSTPTSSPGDTEDVGGDHRQLDAVGESAHGVAAKNRCELEVDQIGSG